jgi:hypothetical protein
MLDLTKAQDQNDVLPAGTYASVITGAETKTTSSGTGEYIKVEFLIVTHGYVNRKIWAQFNIKNDNAQAVSIGMSQLKGLAKAIGFSEAAMASFAPAMLAGKEVGVKTKIKNDPTYGEKAEVASFVALNKLPAHATVKESDVGF